MAFLPFGLLVTASSFNDFVPGSEALHPHLLINVTSYRNLQL